MRLLLGLLFLAKKKKRTLEETVHRIQQGDTTLQNELISSYKPFIAKSVSSVCKRYISETDDEFSIGLIAFNEAIQKYDSDKGSSLLSFADVLIKRRVIDFIRRQPKNQGLSLDSRDELEEDSPQSSIEAELSLDEFQKIKEAEQRREEIIQFSGILKDFGLSFNELIEQSPKHADARKNAMIVAKTLVSDPELQKLLLEKKRLPIKQLEDKVEVSRKTIERNRKYIIAISLIFIGDYIFLKDYIKGVLET
ncbi:RNA polymerase sigma factor SigI [Bacillus dakarensis]|uniref:RNA polymerase sigma factor SigI n=1 Tax=Robertmurraya dakarensis TaxID=1926278 RepID=UPI000981326E|nr:RNA polymerase sigma factor SigI [Bacillus dakarensis]